MERIIGSSSFLPERTLYFRENRDPRLQFELDEENPSVKVTFYYRFEREDYQETDASLFIPEDEFKIKIDQLIFERERVSFETPRGQLHFKRGENDVILFTLRAQTNSGIGYIDVTDRVIPGIILDKY